MITHGAAMGSGKLPFFFSRFTFRRMKEAGNTHYCFHCGGRFGFKPGPNDEVTNSSDHLGLMKNHDPVSHASGVIGDADKFESASEWLLAKMPSDFPFVVAVIPSL